MRELVSVSGWALVNRLGMILFLSTDLVIINWYFGPEMTGQYGLLLLFPELIRQVVEAITSVLNPGFISRYALQDFSGLEQLTSRSLRFLSVGLAIPVGLLCGFANPFLNMWVGPEFLHLDLLLIVLVGHLCINMATLPLSFVVTSYNQVRLQGVVTLALSVVNVALAVAMIPFGLVGVALATAIAMTIRNLVFMGGYSAHLMRLPVWTYYRPLLGGLLGTIAVGVGAYIVSKFMRPDSWIELGVLAAFITTLYGALAFWLALSRGDRSIALSVLPIGWQRGIMRG
jgi:membrane protein EpsK